MENNGQQGKKMYPGELSDENIRRIFEGASDFTVRKLNCCGFTLYAYAIDGLTASGDISEYIITPIARRLRGHSPRELYEAAMDGKVYNYVANPCKDLEDAALLLVNGFCIVLFETGRAIAFEVKTGEKRGISAPDMEHTAKGAKDAFAETIRTNTSLIRRHLRSPDLRIFATRVGKKTLTDVAVVWLEGVTDPELVRRMEKRLEELDVDGFLSPSAVEEYVTGSRATAFPLLQYTERPDSFSRGLLAGRVGLLVDGLPMGYLAPVTVGNMMQSPEDWGKDYVSASCIRVMRYAALVLSLLLPGLYIAMATFHQEMIPLPLLRAIIESKQSVPFSTTVEVLGILLAFELLQESGAYLPQTVGQSVSIIGGIVVGSAAVEAKLVSPLALIAVSTAGVCSFILPNRDFADAVRVWRFAIAVLSALAGLFGMTVGLILMMIHLSGLTSLGVPYLDPFSETTVPHILRNRLHQERKTEK